MEEPKNTSIVSEDLGLDGEVGDVKGIRENLLVLDSETTVGEAIRAMRERPRRSEAVVVDSERKLTRIITAKDLTGALGEIGTEVLGRSISSPGIGTREPEYVFPSDPLLSAVNRMTIGGHRQLPVVDELGHAVGMIGGVQIAQHICAAEYCDDVLGGLKLGKLRLKNAGNILVGGELSLGESAKRIGAKGSPAGLLVTDHAGQSGALRGFASDVDILKAVLDGLPTDTPIRRWCTARPVVTDTEMSVCDALGLCATHTIRHIVVVGSVSDGEHRIVGLVSLHELLSAIAQRCAEIQNPPFASYTQGWGGMGGG